MPGQAATPNIPYAKLPPVERRKRLAEVAAVFLKLGTVAFGGPAAHIAMMDDEVVKRRRWVSREQFLDLLGATHLIPGPNSTELAIHLGYVRAGWRGLLIAGSCFIVPAAVIVLAFAILYARYGTLPQVRALLYGVQPVIVAVVAYALWGLGRTAVKNGLTAAVAILVAVLAAFGVSELALLAAAGAIGWLSRVARSRPPAASMWTAAPMGLWMASETSGAAGTLPLSTLFFTFLKIGSVLYGSGYVLLAFLQAEFVERFGVLTSRQLLDAVAVGQVTPGPVFTTATFIGYLIGGLPGAILATGGIFLPAFVFVALVHPWIPKLRQSPRFSGFLDGVNAASVALMAVVSVQLGRAALVDPLTLVLFAVSLVCLVRRWAGPTWLIVGGGVAGLAAKILLAA